MSGLSVGVPEHLRQIPSEARRPHGTSAHNSPKADLPSLLPPPRLRRERLDGAFRSKEQRAPSRRVAFGEAESERSGGLRRRCWLAKSAASGGSGSCSAAARPWIPIQQGMSWPLQQKRGYSAERTEEILAAQLSEQRKKSLLLWPLSLEASFRLGASLAERCGLEKAEGGHRASFFWQQLVAKPHVTGQSWLDAVRLLRRRSEEPLPATQATERKGPRSQVPGWLFRLLLFSQYVTAGCQKILPEAAPTLRVASCHPNPRASNECRNWTKARQRFGNVLLGQTLTSCVLSRFDLLPRRICCTASHPSGDFVQRCYVAPLPWRHESPAK